MKKALAKNSKDIYKYIVYTQLLSIEKKNAKKNMTSDRGRNYY